MLLRRTPFLAAASAFHLVPPKHSWSIRLTLKLIKPPLSFYEGLSSIKIIPFFEGMTLDTPFVKNVSLSREWTNIHTWREKFYTKSNLIYINFVECPLHKCFYFLLNENENCYIYRHNVYELLKTNKCTNMYCVYCKTRIKTLKKLQHVSISRSSSWSTRSSLLKLC
jgi:hypothetical protein